MKRIYTLILLAVFLLTACGYPSARHNKETTESIKSQSEITSSFKVGNFVMTLPKGYTAEENSTNSYFVSSDNSCCMAIFAQDVSFLDESHVNQLVNSFKGLYKSDDCTIYGERITQGNFAGTAIDMLIYVEEDTSGDAFLTIEGSFTDSWFAYSVMVTYPVNDANTDAYAKSFGQFCYDATYTGNTPRFDFVIFENNDASMEYPDNTEIPTEPAIPGTKENPYQSGMYKVGADLPAGEYLFVATGSTRAYVCVSSDSNKDNIIENENFNGKFFITVKDGQYLEAKRCSFVLANKYTIDANKDGSITEGMYRVGIDIPAGEYKLTAISDTKGYWCIYNNTVVPFNIVKNDNFENSTYVTVREGQYLYLSRCTGNSI